MSTENDVIDDDYGYVSDEVTQSPFNFGGNFGVTYMTKFEYTPTGGKDGAEQDALDIEFTINGTKKNYRLFPVTKAFDKNQNEITDPKSAEMREAKDDLAAKVVHILHAYLETDVIKAALGRPLKSFKEYAQHVSSLLPKNFAEIPLDIFLQFQWQLKGDNKRTYLEIPTKMKYGKWLCAAVAADGGTWEEVRVENAKDNVREALYYQDAQGNRHPFTKNGWFMNSNFAKQVRLDGDSSTATGSATTTNQAPAAGEAPKASGW